tara:strand:- start:2233 stop:2820 length:588 start_codon:yes stop_codon:yes gene_type:complete
MAKKTRVKVDLSQATNEINIFKKAAKDAGAIALRDGVIDSIKRGVSPVKGFGRFQKYSVSYTQAIKGEAFLDPKSGEWVIFRTINGKKRMIAVDKKKYDRGNSEIDRALERKKVRPVNLTLTGKLLKSLFVKVLKNSVVIGFDNKLANIHNKEGAGKSKVIRRMLPTNKGEKFSRSITIRLSEALTKVARGIFKG